MDTDTASIRALTVEAYRHLDDRDTLPVGSKEWWAAHRASKDAFRRRDAERAEISKARTALRLPCRLTWTNKKDEHGHFIKKPGRGDAGWTVYEFESLEARDGFMARHRDADMPGWARIIPGSAELRP